MDTFYLDTTNMGYLDIVPMNKSHLTYMYEGFQKPHSKEVSI
jgi:hypothetical protein